MNARMLRLALLGQLATTLPLVGLIWMVQLVAYPLFARVGAASFPSYHAAHSAWITLVVGPLMLGELVCAGLLLVARPASIPSALPWVGIALVALAWGATAFASVPQHAILGRGFDTHAHHLLVLTNWIRTYAWSARGALLIWIVDRLAHPE
jgi:hypothetical protein